MFVFSASCNADWDAIQLAFATFEYPNGLTFGSAVPSVFRIDVEATGVAVPNYLFDAVCISVSSSQFQCNASIGNDDDPTNDVVVFPVYTFVDNGVIQGYSQCTQMSSMWVQLYADSYAPHPAFPGPRNTQTTPLF